MSVDDREIAFSKFMTQLRRLRSYEECFYHDCKEDIINAHSIQKNKILDRISNDGEMIGFSFSPPFFEPGEIGEAKASTFTGFCKEHDDQIFIPIERSDYSPGNKQQEFLFAYRALAKEYHAKRSVHNQCEIIRNKPFDELRQLADQCGLGEHTDLHGFIRKLKRHYEGDFGKGTKESFEKNHQWRISMNENLKQANYWKIHTWHLAFPEPHGIAVSSMFTITEDHKGNTVNNFEIYKGIQPTFLTIFPEEDSTHVLLSCFSKHRGAFQFIKDVLMDRPLSHKKMVISNILAQYCENMYLSPRVWDNMDSDKQEEFERLYYDTALTTRSTLIPNKRLNLFASV